MSYKISHRFWGLDPAFCDQLANSKLLLWLTIVWMHPNRPLCSTGPTIYSYTRPGQVSERPFVYYYRYRRIPNSFFFQILRIGGKEGVREREWSKRQKVWIRILKEFPLLPKRVIVKFIYSEKATKFCEIFTLLLTGTTVRFIWLCVWFKPEFSWTTMD